MSISPLNQHRRSWWRDGRPSLVTSSVIGLVCALVVFLVYLLLGKGLHVASYIPIVSGFLAVGAAPLWFRGNGNGHSQQHTNLQIALGFAASEIIYALALLFLILNVLGS
jgi:hypothetical protein